MSNDANQNQSEQVNTGQLDKVEFTNEYIYDQAMKIVATAEKHGVVMRLIGSTAFINHCPKHSYLYTEETRQLTDVDLIAYSKVTLDKMDALFAELDYEPIRALGWHATTRDIYVNAEKLYIDVFRDVLDYCHPISFVGRLELDSPTIPLVDLLLEKVQIVEINAKDLFDVVVLVLEHDLYKGIQPETIDLDRILKLWSNDWGFYYTGITNLKKALGYMNEMEDLKDEERKIVSDRIGDLLQQVEEAPKSLKWKLRSKVGTRMRWYEEVENVER